MKQAELEYDVSVARLNFIGIMLATLVYGVHATLFLSCLKPVYNRGLRLFSYMTIVFLLATAAMAMQIYWYEKVVIPHGHPMIWDSSSHYISSVVRTTIFVVMSCFSEGIVLYRFYVIFHVIGGHTYVFAVISAAVLVTLITTGIMCIPAITGLGYTWLPQSCNARVITYLTLSMASHVILTSLIVGRILWFRRLLRKTVGRQSGSLYISVAAILVESASLYTIWALVSLILYSVNSPLQFVFLPVLMQIPAIPALLIITSVVNGYALSKDNYSAMFPSTRLPSFGSIKFSPSEPAYPFPAYCSQWRLCDSTKCELHGNMRSCSTLRSSIDKV